MRQGYLTHGGYDVRLTLHVILEFLKGIVTMKWGKLRSPVVGEMDRSKIVVIPLGALEQHGRHLPTLTDTIITTELAERIDSALGDAVLTLPTLWLGASDHHLAFPGTVSFSLETYVRVLCDIVESIIHGGFRKLFFLNGHGGNLVPGIMAINMVKQRHRDIEDLRLVFSSYWELAAAPMRQITEMQTWRLTHACEYETSMVLFLEPELVEMSAARGGTASIDSQYWYPDYSQPGKITPAYLFEEVTTTGAMGRPELASAEKGQKLLDAIAQEIINFLRDFQRWGKIEKGIAA